MVAKQPQKARDSGPEWAIRSRCVVAPDGVRAAALLIRGEEIAAVLPFDQVPAGCVCKDVADHVLLPGLVDAHVHINEPGRTEWEGFTTATRAAAAGGVTTVVDMPLNSSPVTTTATALAAKLATAEGKLAVDCGFYGGIVPGNAGDIQSLIAAGVLGFKAFLCPSGIDDFPNVGAAELRAVLPQLAAADMPLLVHAELVRKLPADVEDRLAREPRSYAAYLASRPRAWEQAAIELVLGLAHEYGCRLHIVHLSSADPLGVIAAARSMGMALTVETCPHYLCFAAEDIPDGDPRFKCAPPIREAENRARLWQGLQSGLIDTIGSDHSPAPAELKLESGNLQRAWGGIASLQLGLSVIHTEGQRRGESLGAIVDCMSRRPAEVVGLGDRKGRFAAGYDADLVVFDPEQTFVVRPGLLHDRHKITPYEGRKLRGRVRQTFLRGQLVYDEGTFPDSPHGRPILRPHRVQEA